jgi:hypothetical protein
MDPFFKAWMCAGLVLILCVWICFRIARWVGMLALGIVSISLFVLGSVMLGTLPETSRYFEFHRWIATLGFTTCAILAGFIPKNFSVRISIEWWRARTNDPSTKP